MKTLVQRRLFRERTFQLAREHIRVVDRTPIGGRSYDVPYDVLFGERVELMTTAVQTAIVSAILAVSAIVWTLVVLLDPNHDAGMYLLTAATGIGSVGAGIFWAFSRQELIHFYDSRSALYIRRDRPSVKEVDEFLAEAYVLGRDRMRSALLPLKRSDDERKNRAFAFLLLDKRILSDDECMEYVKLEHSPYREHLN